MWVSFINQREVKFLQLLYNRLYILDRNIHTHPNFGNLDETYSGKEQIIPCNISISQET